MANAFGNESNMRGGSGKSFDKLNLTIINLLLLSGKPYGNPALLGLDAGPGFTPCFHSPNDIPVLPATTTTYYILKENATSGTLISIRIPSTHSRLTTSRRCPSSWNSNTLPLLELLASSIMRLHWERTSFPSLSGPLCACSGHRCPLTVFALDPVRWCILGSGGYEGGVGHLRRLHTHRGCSSNVPRTAALNGCSRSVDRSTPPQCRLGIFLSFLAAHFPVPVLRPFVIYAGGVRLEMFSLHTSLPQLRFPLMSTSTLTLHLRSDPYAPPAPLPGPPPFLASPALHSTPPLPPPLLHPTSALHSLPPPPTVPPHPSQPSACACAFGVWLTNPPPRRSEIPAFALTNDKPGYGLRGTAAWIPLEGRRWMVLYGQVRERAGEHGVDADEGVREWREEIEEELSRLAARASSSAGGSWRSMALVVTEERMKERGGRRVWRLWMTRMGLIAARLAVVCGGCCVDCAGCGIAVSGDDGDAVIGLSFVVLALARALAVVVDQDDCDTMMV
ncbi:hypothetical protein R3P38DRAFT_3214405 [Favolaschia claudopus]|uniref:Uncharacterized protein n=1 Tax=Favolaschia claudopus TaxID=2862362 RepID=A0AAW0ABY6_9AGAR